MAFMQRANIALFAVLVFTALSGIPYVVDQARKNIMPTETPTPKPVQTTSQASAPKPQFPENRVLKEGQMPKR